MDSVALLTSVALQYGVPLENLVAKFRGVHFEPAGLTSNRQIPVAYSIVDYIFRWLELRFLSSEHQAVTTSTLEPIGGQGGRITGGAKRTSVKKSSASAPNPTRRGGNSKTRSAPPKTDQPAGSKRSSATQPSSLGNAASTANAAPSLIDATSTGLGCPECGSILV